MKYAFIKEHSGEFSIKLMCKIFQLSRNCYYRWLGIEKQEDTHLHNLAKELFLQSQSTYGTRRVKKDIEQSYGVIVSRRKIGRIMRKLGLVCKSKKRFRIRTTDSNHNFMIAPNLLQHDFYTSAPDQIYTGEITYIHTKEG